MTKPAKLKFTIYQGATFRKRLTWKGPLPGWADVATVWAVAARVRSLTALAETLTPLPMVAAAAAELEHPLAPVHRSCMGQQAGFFTPEGK